MESLENVVAILRHGGRQDLSALLVDARMEFQCLDIMFAANSDAVYELVNAVIHAPISACKTLRELPDADQTAILDALKDTWPVDDASGMVIDNVSYNIDKDSLREDITSLYTEPIGWQSVDRTMNRIRDLLLIASTEDHYKEIGLLCREVLTSVAQEVFDPDLHPKLQGDDTKPSKSDAKRMIERYVASEFPGKSNRETRKCVNAALDLAHKVTHSSTSSYCNAQLCVQAVFNVIGLITIVAGKRGRP